jgi:hypothetical protein
MRRFVFGLRSAFLSAVIPEYPDFSGLDRVFSKSLD